ncbi:MAG: sigma-54 interaction domain-containing protein [Lachnospiraceae bacterium]
MKKSIAIIAYDPIAGKAYAEQVKQAFGNRIVVRNYSTIDGSAKNMDKCDLYMASTDALDSMGDSDQYIPAGSQRMEILVTYKKEAIRILEEIPKGTTVLYVNITEMMAREAVTQLEQLGVTHLKFILYAPGSTLSKTPQIAVTPDEERYVPVGVTKVINLGQRTCSSDTLIEAALRLGYDDLLEADEFKQYLDSVCANTYYFDRMMDRSARLESQFDILMEVLDQGVIAVNEHGKIYAINKAAHDITRFPPGRGIGQLGEELFPYIQFHKCLTEKAETQPQVVRVAENLVAVYVRPILRRNICVGGVAILQQFNEMERRQNELRGQLINKGDGHRAKYCFDDVIGRSESIIKTKKILEKMARTESPVLLIGETGTGKELFAHSVHNASRRRDQPFVAINCGAMPENLLESELFGYEYGAFTGAKKGGRPGLFEFAHQGTLFLDEVEGMSPSLQVKLLRVLQEREIMRVGGNQIIHVDVRIVAATNEELERKVEAGTFRRDLYYRLNALPVLIPPLRDRGDDVFYLLDYFRKRLGGTFRLSDEIRNTFREYYWPGNIRELHNVLDYLNFTGHQVITKADLPPVFRYDKRAGRPDTEKEFPPSDEKLNQTFVFSPDCPSRAERILLEILYEIDREGKCIGRDGLLLEAERRNVKLSQPQVRKVLGMLEQKGFIIVSRGRGGSKITKKGMDRIAKAN